MLWWTHILHALLFTRGFSHPACIPPARCQTHCCGRVVTRGRCSSAKPLIAALRNVTLVFHLQSNYEVSSGNSRGGLDVLSFASTERHLLKRRKMLAFSGNRAGVVYLFSACPMELILKILGRPARATSGP